MNYRELEDYMRNLGLIQLHVYGAEFKINDIVSGTCTRNLCPAEYIVRERASNFGRAYYDYECIEPGRRASNTKLSMSGLHTVRLFLTREEAVAHYNSAIARFIDQAEPTIRTIQDNVARLQGFIIPTD